MARMGTYAAARERLKHYVTGAIERGEAEAITESAMPKFVPTDEMVDALKLFASLHGRHWKGKLRSCWHNGWGRSLQGYRGRYVAPLQDMRNTAGGIAFLDHYKLPK